MQRTFIDTRVMADLSWWHWTMTIPLLAAHLLGVPWAIEGALALCAALALYYLARIRRVQPFPVQVRLAYIGWLLVGLLPGMQWMLYVSLVGLLARVLFGYCLLGRMLSLAWFNRSEPVTLALIRRVFLAPGAGGLFQRESRLEAAPQVGSCSLVHGKTTGLERRFRDELSSPGVDTARQPQPAV